jgi:nucleotide-binding universal stress UspA family protein/CBS domain-containing protein
MTTRNKPFLALTAGDLMTGPVEAIRQDRTLREAAEVLRRADVTGAPVVDEEGRCVGVLSRSDFVRWTQRTGRNLDGRPLASPIRTCAYLEGERCSLPAGTCPLQVLQRTAEGKAVPFCQMPAGFLVDWQVVIEALPDKEVRCSMTADPVMVSAAAPLADVARMMVDAHIHRVIVVDGQRRPLGIVSSTDIVAAVGRHCSGPDSGFTPRTILHPTDFSQTAGAAFRTACSVARKDNARLIVLHVYPPPICHGEVVARRQPDSYEDDLWRLLGQYQMPDAAVPVEHRLVEGDAATEILHLAQEEGCDLIVVGTQGRTGLSRLLLGSVAEQVVRRSPCPVLTVRHAEDTAGKQPPVEKADRALAPT